MADARASSTPTPMYPIDTTLLLSVLMLAGIGIVMIYSASSAIALKKFGSGYFFLKKQALYTGVGGCVLFLTSSISYRRYRPFVYILLLMSILLLLATQISGYGHSAGGATRWIRIAGFSLQPSEFTRLAMIIYLAYSLSKKQDRIDDFFIGFLPHVMVLMILACIILSQPDFGTVAILFLLTWTMMFIGRVPFKYLAGSLLPILPLAGWIMISASYRMERLLSFLNPWEHQMDGGYQIVHSLMAFGSGGIWGKGLGNGYQKLFYLPEPHTDFIFSVIGEELGLWGVSAIVGIYLTIIWRGIIIARRTEDLFGSLLAAGLTSAIAIQTCINMCVSMGLLPTKGLTLPFLSYGGTSLLMNMAAVGILINIGKTGNNG